MEIKHFCVYVWDVVWGQQPCIKLIKRGMKDIHNVTNYLYFKYIWFILLSIHQKILEKKRYYVFQKYVNKLVLWLLTIPGITQVKLNVK